MPPIEPVTVLAVASAKILEQLHHILVHSRWQVVNASTIAESVTFLRKHAMVVLVCEAILPDGTWSELVQRTLRLPIRPPVVVLTGSADESLWMDVLNRGGYSLAKPLHEHEVFQVLSHAWRHLREVASSASIV